MVPRLGLPLRQFQNSIAKGALWTSDDRTCRIWRLQDGEALPLVILPPVSSRSPRIIVFLSDVGAHK